LIFARVIALFMFVWPYVRSHIVCTQLVICLLSNFIHIWYLGWPWSEHVHIIPISRTVDFARVIAIFMFVWPYVRPRILCKQLVICLLSHFIHILYLGWPWSEHAHIIPISRMVDFCESYSRFHVCMTIRPFVHLVYATSHLSFVAFYSYLVSWLAMIWACAYATSYLSFVAFYSYLVSWLTMIWVCAYYTDFTDGWFLRESKPFSCLFDHTSVRTSCVRK
jgi:hypothetical protein